MDPQSEDISPASEYPSSPRSYLRRRRTVNLWALCILGLLLLLCAGGLFAFFQFDPIDLMSHRESTSEAIVPSINQMQVSTATAISPLAENTPAGTSAPLNDHTPTPTPDSSFQNPLIPFEAVVKILVSAERSDGALQSWWGSGTIISANGLILTSAHVVASTPEIDIYELVVALCLRPDQSPVALYHARIVQIDQNLDIAILQIESDIEGNPIDPDTLDLAFVPLGDSDHLQLGDPLTILGYPEIGGPTITMTRGEVAGFSTQQAYGMRAFIKTTAIITGGNSGGAVLNENGELVGMPTQIGQGAGTQYADCRSLADTNNDGVIDDNDTCIPVGGFINSLRPIKLLMPFIEAALSGENNYVYTTPGSTPFIPTGIVVLSEDFSEVSSTFPEIEAPLMRAYYDDGAYWLEIHPDGEDAYIPLVQEKRDAAVTVTVLPAIESGRMGFGILCRRKGNDAYGFEISNDGYYAIWREVEGERVFLSYWQYTSLLTSGEPVAMGVSCTGDRLTLASDYQILVEVQDDVLDSGSVELFIKAYNQNEDGAAVSFDDLMLFIP